MTKGYPDKICDAISDTTLDVLMAQDPMSRVIRETTITTGLVLVTGEITTNTYVDIQKIIRKTVREIGYNRVRYGSNCDAYGMTTAIDEQSQGIALGVNKALEAEENKISDEGLDVTSAGDQGMMLGFAANRTEEYIPHAIPLAHKLTRRLTGMRRNGALSYLRSGGKPQITVGYDENDKPMHLDAMVLSTRHNESITQEQIHANIKKHIFGQIFPQGMVDESTKFFTNPTGRSMAGDPQGDSGLTRRKIIVGIYGEYTRHGGGALSSRDRIRVDRSATYATQYAVEDAVAAGLADRCEIQLPYAIGVAHPTSVMVNTYGTGRLEDERLVEIVRSNFDLRPTGIIRMLDLRRPIYKQTAAYRHFGRNDLDLPWEKLNKVGLLRSYL